MKKLLLSTAVALVLASGAPLHAQIIADWTFETSKPATSGPISPEVGSGSATGSHAGSATYSSPAGNGSSHSFSSNTWAIGDYYQFQTSTVGYQNVMLTWDQISSSTGPSSFQLQYSTNGTTFANFGSSYAVAANSSVFWSSTTPITTTSYSVDLSSIGALAGDASVYFRLEALNSPSSASGTDRVDNFIIQGTAVAAPEPSSWTLALAALGFLACLRLRRAATR